MSPDSRSPDMKILIVDDETKAREYLWQGLTEAGCLVEVAASGLWSRATG
jgi:DNA-binding response OmpR family regulator